MGRTSISLHFGRGEPPSGVPLDYVAEDDAWMIGAVLDEATLMGPPIRLPPWWRGGSVLDFVLPEWQDHVRYNSIAILHVWRALSRLLASYSAAWAQYYGSNAPGEEAETAPRLGLRLSTRIKTGLLRAQGARSGRAGVSLRVRFGPRGDLGKVSSNFFVSSAGCSIRTFDTPADRAAHTKPGGGKAWRAKGLYSTGKYHSQPFEVEADMKYVARPRDLSFDVSGMPMFEAFIRDVVRVPPPATLSAVRLEDRPLYLTVDDVSQMQYFVEVFSFSENTPIERFVLGHRWPRRFERFTGQRWYLDGRGDGPVVIHPDFSAIERPFSGSLRMHLGKTKLNKPFGYLLSEPGSVWISGGDNWYYDNEMRPAGWVSMVDIGNEYPHSSDPDWIMHFVAPEACWTLIEGLRIEALPDQGDHPRRLANLRTPRFELRNPSDFVVLVVVVMDLPMYGVSLGGRLAPGEVRLVGGDVYRVIELEAQKDSVPQTVDVYVESCAHEGSVQWLTDHVEVAIPVVTVW